jgi:hypothetical protein
MPNQRRETIMSSASEVLRSLAELGVKVRIEGGRLKLRPGNKIPDDLVEDIRTCKSEIIDLLTRELRLPGKAPPAADHREEDLRNLYRRAAVLVCNGLSWDEALSLIRPVGQA